MTNNQSDNSLGKITISREVIATLAGVGATECIGVVGMVSSNFFSDGLTQLLGKESLSKGVNVKYDGETLQIVVNVVVGYGTNIPIIAQNIVENITYIVEKFTGLKVDKVEINVSGIKMLD